MGEEKMGKKEEYYKMAEEQLREWGTKIDELKEFATGENAKAKYLEMIDTLLKRKEDTQKRLKELGKAKDEAWVDIRVGVENAAGELKEAVEKAISQFK